MTVVAAAAATALPSLWTNVLRQWAGSKSPIRIDPDLAENRSEAVAHLKFRIRQYERMQPSYAADLRTALAQLERADAAG